MSSAADVRPTDIVRSANVASVKASTATSPITWAGVSFAGFEKLTVRSSPWRLTVNHRLAGILASDIAETAGEQGVEPDRRPQTAAGGLTPSRWTDHVDPFVRQCRRWYRTRIQDSLRLPKELFLWPPRAAADAARNKLFLAERVLKCTTVETAGNGDQ